MTLFFLAIDPEVTQVIHTRSVNMGCKPSKPTSQAKVTVINILLVVSSASSLKDTPKECFPSNIYNPEC